MAQTLSSLTKSLISRQNTSGNTGQGRDQDCFADVAIPIPKKEQEAHLQEAGLVGKVRLIRPGNLTKLNQRSGALLLPLLDFIKTTPFHSSTLGNALSVLSKEG